MKTLLSVDPEKRDPIWEKQFLEKVARVEFRLVQDHPIVGPDNMPYMATEIVEEGGEPAEKLFKWLSERGIGLVVSPDKSPPDFVMTFGMIWNYLATGNFIRDGKVDDLLTQPLNASAKMSSATEFELKEGIQMYAGVPNESYLPQGPRGVFRQFLKDQDIPSPRVLLLSMDGTNFDLCFSAESLGKPPQEEWDGILQGFSWFFPLHYSFSILSEKAIENFEFIDL